MSADDRTVSWDDVRAKRPPNEEAVARIRARFDRERADRFITESSDEYGELDADEMAALLEEARRRR
jgi:hypothetical protein